MSVVGLDQVLGLSTDLQCQFHLSYPSVFENYNDCIVLGRSDFFLLQVECNFIESVPREDRKVYCANPLEMLE